MKRASIKLFVNNSLRFFTLVIFCVSIGSVAYAQEEPLSQDYEVWINGAKANVYIARVQDKPLQCTGCKD